jgi:hypothetical protein
MKKLITFIGALLISSAAFTQTESIEGKWSQNGFSNTLKIYENGLIYTYYCSTGNCDSLYNTFEAADGNHIPGVDGYTLQNGILTIDLDINDNDPGFALGSVTFTCEGNIYQLVTSVAEATYVRLNTNVNDCLSTSINENDQNKLTQIYPNPATDFVNFKSANTIEKITLCNVLGEEVLSKEVNAQNFDMDISILIPGSYFAKLDSKGQSQTIKLLKY